MAAKKDTLLTPEIVEAEMPKGLLPIDQYRWRRNKENELRAKAKIASENQGSSQTAVSGNNNAEKSETNDKPVPEMSAADLSNNEISTETEKEVSYKPIAVKKAKAGVFKNPVSKKNQAECIYVRGVHKSVIKSLRRLFPGGMSNGDMIAAAVYILTDGDCEVTEKAMQLVESYGKREGTDISERLSNVERMLRDHARMLQSIELCTCYNTFDRRYGSKERRVSPKDTEFREQGNLDMLERLRRQADDQRKIDMIERGRDIYNSIKDKNDK